MCGTELQLHHVAASPPSAKTRLTSTPFSCHCRQFCTLLSGGDKVTLLPCMKYSREGGACWSFPDLSAPDIVQHQSLPNPDGKIIGVRRKRCLLTANSHSVSYQPPSPLFALLSVLTEEAVSCCLHTSPDYHCRPV